VKAILTPRSPQPREDAYASAAEGEVLAGGQHGAGVVACEVIQGIAAHPVVTFQRNNHDHRLDGSMAARRRIFLRMVAVTRQTWPAIQNAKAIRTVVALILNPPLST
jgi:hypothetical protein